MNKILHVWNNRPELAQTDLQTSVLRCKMVLMSSALRRPIHCV